MFRKIGTVVNIPRPPLGIVDGARYSWHSLEEVVSSVPGSLLGHENEEEEVHALVEVSLANE